MTRLLAVLALVATACNPPSAQSDINPGVNPDPAVDPGTNTDPGTPSTPAVNGSYDGTIHGSGAMVRHPDGTVFIADGDNGDILLRGEGSGDLDKLQDVGEEPARMLIVGDAVFVTLRAEGAVARLSYDGSLELQTKAEVGAEPFDLEFVRSTGQLYVALTQEGAVVALDPDTLEETERYDLGGEPRWLERRGDDLFIAFADEARVATIDVVTGASSEFSLPVVPRFTDFRCVPRDLQPRLTGDMTLDNEKGLLFVPAVYVDTQLAELPENTGEPGGVQPCSQVEAATVSQNEEPPPYYAPPVPPADPAKIGRLNSVVVAFDLTTGVARKPLAVSQSVLGTDWSDPGRTYRGVPGDLALTHENGQDFLLVPLPGTGKIVSISYDGARTDERVGVLDTRFRGVMAASMGVDSVVADGENVWGWSTVSRRLSVGASSNVWPGAGVMNTLVNGQQTPSELAPSVLRGRELFNTSEHSGMVAPDSGTSCNACHVEGREDGVTWKFEDMPRQTPSLAGEVSSTAPFTWTGEVESVEEEIHRTSSQRMGGSGLTDSEARDVAAYVEWVRDVKRPTPKTAEVEAQVALGREIFSRAEVGCDTCHAGADGADGEVHTVFGFETATATPVLRGIGATAPYLHDGSAATLRDVLEMARSGAMGNTSMLNDEEMQALEAYLKHW